MLEPIIEQENYKDIIGLRYPTIFISKIVLQLNNDQLPEAEVDYFCLFEIPVDFTEEQISSFKADIGNLGHEFYLGTYHIETLSDDSLDENKLKNLFMNKNKKSYFNPLYFMDQNYQGRDFIKSLSSLINDGEQEEIFNSSGKRFLMFSDNVDFIIEGFDTFSLFDVFSFSYESEVFNDITDYKAMNPTEVMMDDSIDLDLFKFKCGRVSVENVVEQQKINAKDKIIFVDQDGVTFTGEAMYSLSSTYHKAPLGLKEEIYNSLKPLLVSIITDTGSKMPRAKRLANSLMTVLEDKKNDDKLLFLLNRQNRSTVVKTTALPVGTLYTQVNEFINTVNQLLIAEEEVTKRVVSATKIIDKYSLFYNNYTILEPGFTGVPSSDSEYLYRPIVSRKAILAAEDNLQTKGFENGAEESIFIENRALFFIDQKKIINYRSLLSEFLDVESLRILLKGASSLNKFFERQFLTLSRASPSDKATNRNGYFTLSFLVDKGASEDNIPDTPSLTRKNSDRYADVTFPYYMTATSLDGLLEGDTEEQDEKKTSYLAERMWDFGEKALYPLFFASSGYDISVFEFFELHESGPALNNSEVAQNFYIEYELEDNTAEFYEEYIRKPFKETIDLYSTYVDEVEDFCSTNSQGNFNNFFFTAVTNKYQNLRNPWEVAVFYYVYMNALYKTSWYQDENDVAVNRQRDKILSLEKCNKQIEVLLKQISPLTGNKQSVLELKREMENLYNNHFANTQESTVGDRTGIYDFPSGGEPQVRSQSLKLEYYYPLTKDIMPSPEIDQDSLPRVSDDPPQTGQEDDDDDLVPIDSPTEDDPRGFLPGTFNVLFFGDKEVEEGKNVESDSIVEQELGN